MKKKLAVCVGAMVLGLGTVPLAQASAHTVKAPGSESGAQASCPSGYACFWPGQNFSGQPGKVAGDNPNFAALPNSAHSCGTGWEDCISSIRNSGTQCTVYFYSLRNYSKAGRWHSLSRGDEVGNFGTVYHDAAFDNTISSNKWCSS
ncbi:peptidase inhibitor family I36 protein [Streptomyces sp. YS-3]|uniref:peptidase inhibitor family I36 protein n=1 Tax=Streptomyces sp. YS-3 TaxID=3381352 RepID=UPI0038628B25